MREKEKTKAKFSLDILYQAYLDCRKNKNTTLQARKFEFEREKNLLKLYSDITSGNYKIGKSICFVISEPKYREIWAGSFRDRIVHHVIYNAIQERFLPKFILDTYSCIPSRGTLFGAKRAEKFAKSVTSNFSKEAYFLKMDIKNYFVSINKEILFNLVKKELDLKEEAWLLNLIEMVIFHDPRKNVFIKSPKWLLDKLPRYKSLFYTTNEKGLPIGNLTSQFFSNVYLNEIDQFAKHKLKCKYYSRYVDDILVLSESPKYLNWVYHEINEFLMKNLKLELNHKKKNINKVKRGFDFVGHVIKPNQIHIRKKTINKCYLKIKNWKEKEEKTREELIEFRSQINSYLGMLRHSDGFQKRKKILEEIKSENIKPDKNYSKIILK